MLHSKPDTMPNKCQPARRRLTVSLPFNPLRSKTWAHQPEELTRHRPAAPHCSGAKALSNIYKYPHKGGATMKPGHPLANCIDPSLDTDEEIHNLKLELQRFHDYRCQDQETIQYLEKHLAVEQQLGYAEGMAQAA